MDINTIVETFLKLNWQTVIGVVVIVWCFTYDIKKSIRDIKTSLDKIDSRIDSLEERIFFLSAGKTLAQAIKDQKMKERINDDE